MTLRAVTNFRKACVSIGRIACRFLPRGRRRLRLACALHSDLTRGYIDEIKQLPSPPKASSAAVRATMQGNRRRDTVPEKRLRSALFALGLRFRVDHPIRLSDQPRPIRPDIVFTRAKIAVFVDGCFWHGCPRHGTSPRRNSQYWDAKLARNRERDRRYDTCLSSAGWTVMRFWEHDEPERAAEQVARMLAKPRSA
jgi:DNA mismatch endonuclease (patch repair protein)